MRFTRGGMLISAWLTVYLLLPVTNWPDAAWASGRRQVITQYANEVWQSEQGLPQNAVQALAQTRDGYLWLGTQEGLARFDGVRFTVFNRRNTPELKHNNIQSLLESRDGSLWIGTSDGLTRLKDRTFTTFTTDEGLSNNYITSLFEDAAGKLWIGTSGGGLNLFQNAGFLHYTTKEGLANDVVSAIHADHAGNLWIGTNEGLDCFKDGRFTHYTTKEGLASNVVLALEAGRDQSLWVGTSGGLMQLKEGRFTTYTQKDGLSHNTVKALYEDEKDGLWIGTSGGGLTRLLAGKFSSFTTKEGLSNDFVLSLLTGREGRLWVGTYGGGLNRLGDTKFVTYTTQEGLAADMVRAVYETQDGSIWLGTQGGGLSRFQEGRFTNYTTREGLGHDVVMSFLEDRAGNLWIGTDGGLSRFNNGRFTNFTTKDGLVPGSVRAIYEDRDGGLWVGTRSGGLSRFKDGKFTSYAAQGFVPDQGFDSGPIWMISGDQAGTIWIGKGNKLTYFKDGQFNTYTTQDGLPNGYVFSFVEDQDHTYWVGTYGGGLSRLRDGKFTNFTTKEGLFDDNIYRVLDDGLGYLWMSCNKGIFRVSKQELNDFAARKINSITTTPYGIADGMKSSECNGGSQPAGWRAKDGRLWFPTLKGVAVINPSDLKTNQLPPPVSIEQILIDKQPVALGQSATLPAGRGELEFYYTGLSFLAPGKVKFKYKLEGFDQEWVDAGTRRVAYYTNIPPGHYRFRVVACNNDGVWNQQGAAFPFYLQPHFYQTYWFYVLCWLVVLGLAAALYLLRIWQVRAHERELVLQVNARTQELQQEIAERKRIERSLRESDEHNRTLVENTQELIQSVASDGRFNFVNRVWLATLGYTEAELPHLKLQDIVAPQLWPHCQGMFSRVLTGETFFSVQATFIAKDGRAIEVEGNVSPHYVANQVVATQGFFRDVTERKRAEEALRESQAMFQKLFDSAPDAIVVTNQHQRIERINAQAEALFGYGENELPGQPLAVLIPERFTASHARQAGGYIERPYLRHMGGGLELYARRKDGSEFPVDITLGPLETERGLVVLSTIRDITERKQAEALLVAEQRILETIATTAPLIEVLDMISRCVEAQASGTRCSILLLDTAGLHLHLGSAPSLPEAYNQAIDGIAIGPAMGSCGSAAFYGKPVVVEDIATDPLWSNFSALALHHGLRACWSTPIFSSNRKVLGTFALYLLTPRGPSPRELHLIERATHLTELAIERRQAEDALRQAKEAAEAASQAKS
jgi:PAS domain S-box-containing protein